MGSSRREFQIFEIFWIDSFRLNFSKISPTDISIWPFLHLIGFIKKKKYLFDSKYHHDKATLQVNGLVQRLTRASARAFLTMNFGFFSITFNFSKFIYNIVSILTMWTSTSFQIRNDKIKDEPFKRVITIHCLYWNLFYNDEEKKICRHFRKVQKREKRERSATGPFHFTDFNHSHVVVISL